MIPPQIFRITQDVWLARAYTKIACIMAIIVTLAVFPLPSPFPIPFIKLASLAVGAWIIVAIAILGSNNNPQERKNVISLALYRFSLVAFIVALLVRIALQDEPHIGLWGITGRQIGGLLYLCLAAISLTVTMHVARKLTAQSLLDALLVAGGLSGAYGVVEFLGWHPIPFDVVAPISTLGNLDHTSSWHAIVAVASASSILRRTHRLKIRFLVSGVLICASWLVLYLYFKHGIDQGLVIGCIGGLAIVFSAARLRLSSDSHKAWISRVAVLLLLLVLSYGIFRAWPSNGVRDRLFLWQDAWRMMWLHPLTGVGIARFGAVYYQVQSLAEVIAVGPWLYCDDAHGVAFHLAATGGLVVVLPYLLILIQSIYASVATLSRDHQEFGASRSTLAAVVILYWLQASISPELSAIAVWGWLASAVVARDVFKECYVNNKWHRRPLALRNSSWSIPHGLRYAILLAATAAGSLALVRQARAEIIIGQLSNRRARLEDLMESRLRANFERSKRRELAAGVVQARPGDENAAKEVVRYLRDSHDVGGAIFLAEAAVRRDRDQPQLYLTLADLYEGVGKTDTTRALLRVATAKWPLSPFLWFARGYAAAVVNDTSDAQSSWAKGESLQEKIRDQNERTIQMRARGLSTFPWLNRQGSVGTEYKHKIKLDLSPNRHLMGFLADASYGIARFQVDIENNSWPASLVSAVPFRTDDSYRLASSSAWLTTSRAAK